MARVTNRQLGNVGNLGDILKHAALVELASLLSGERARVSYVDTHAFRLHAPLADREQWSRDVDARVAANPAYARYASMERVALATKGHYRCSAGIVIDVLGKQRGRTVLGEANAATRAELVEQIAAEGLDDVVVVDNAADVGEGNTRARGDAASHSAAAVLIHVDPFRLSTAQWSEFAGALDAIVARASDAALLVYRYSRAARAPWPDAPRGTTLVAETRGGPHELAVYASPGIAGAVIDRCSLLGWARSSE
jgi:hypothetical protein